MIINSDNQDQTTVSNSHFTISLAGVAWLAPSGQSARAEPIHRAHRKKFMARWLWRLVIFKRRIFYVFWASRGVQMSDGVRNRNNTAGSGSKVSVRSKKPDNSAFKQQRLPAWQPVLTAKSVLPVRVISRLPRRVKTPFWWKTSREISIRCLICTFRWAVSFRSSSSSELFSSPLVPWSSSPLTACRKSSKSTLTVPLSSLSPIIPLLLEILQTSALTTKRARIFTTSGLNLLLELHRMEIHRLAFANRNSSLKKKWPLPLVLSIHPQWFIWLLIYRSLRITD